MSCRAATHAFNLINTQTSAPCITSPPSPCLCTCMLMSWQAATQTFNLINTLTIQFFLVDYLLRFVSASNRVNFLW